MSLHSSVMRPFAAALGLLLVCTLSGCRTELFAGLSQNEANEVLQALVSRGVAAHKAAQENQTYNVEVDDADIARALRTTQELGLPRQRFTSMGEVFKREGLVSTPSEDRLRYIYAVSQELEHTLSLIPGVLRARVQPVIPANDPLADKVRPSSASVFISHRADANVQDLAPAIRNLVMRSIEGLPADNISLSFFAAPAEVAANDAALASAAAHDRTLVAGLAVALAAALAAAGYFAWRARETQVLLAAATAPPAGTAEAALPSAHWWKKLRVVAGGATPAAEDSRRFGA